MPGTMPAQDEEAINEHSQLLSPRLAEFSRGRDSSSYTGDAESILSTRLSKGEHVLQTGEGLPYNDYTTIDWLHDSVSEHATWRHKSHF